MNFFEALKWPNKHMDLKYVMDNLYGEPIVTSVYATDKRNDADLDYVTREFGQDIKTAQSQIESNRVIMLVLFLALVMIPAIVLSVINNTVLPAGGAIVYSFLVVFLVEMFNQVEINRMLARIDKDLDKTNAIHTK